MIQINVSSLRDAVASVEAEIRETLTEENLREIGFTGAEIIRDEAKRNAAAFVRTGTLYRAIIVKRLEEKSDGGKVQTYLVTVRKGQYGMSEDAFYAGFVELGHKIVPKKPKGVSWKTHRTAAAWEYGGATVPAKPFMRPAFHNKREAAIDAMTDKLTEILRRNARS